MKRIVIGLDFGTLSARAAAFDIRNGEELASAMFAYPHGCMDEALPDGTPVGLNEFYQHPKDYEDALAFVIREVLNRGGISPEEVLCVGTDFTFCTMLPVYEDGTPLCYNEKNASRSQAYVKLWKHHGAQKEADEVNRIARERNEAFLSWCGGTVSSEYLLPKIWETLNKDPELFYEAAYMLEAGDWVTWRLTGRQVRNKSMAGYRGLYKEGWPSREFLSALDERLRDLADTKLKAPMIPAGSLAGCVDEKGAALTGLLPGTLVSACQGDCYTTVLATGITGAAHMAAVIGTSAVYMIQGKEDINVPGSNGTVMSGMLEGFYGYESGQCCLGDHFSWFETYMAGADIKEEAEKRGMPVLSLLEEKAKALKPGESGVIALDWWNGTRSLLMDGELTGLFLGCTLKTRPEELFRALIEATAFGARLILDNDRKCGINIGRFTAAGGITHKNDLLMQIFADVLNMDIEVAATLECGALGSAVYALTAAGKERGGCDTYKEAVDILVKPAVSVYRPDPAHVKVYDELYREYVKLHDYFGRDETSPMKELLKIKKEAVKDRQM